jgi:histidine triad (HIT) family protein
MDGCMVHSWLMEDCLFCKIAGGALPSKMVHQDDRLVAFEDINPQAPTHVLVVPKKHIPTLNDVSPADADLLGLVTATATKIAADRQIARSGYRLVWNTNRGAGQSVFHIHLHLLGGRSMSWPPG